MRNLRLIISYDGTDFHGWQRQPDAPTVQACLESALERILGERVQVCGSGRTDAGVHALNQVGNFKTACRIPCENLLKALNNTLQPTVRIKDISEVPLSFHARHDARSKTYRYRILQAPVASPFVNRFIWHYPFPLDIRRMAQAAKLFEGEHDFTSFAASEGPEGRQPVAHGVGVREKNQPPVILSPSPVILSEAKNPGSPLRVNSAKDPRSSSGFSDLRTTAEILRCAQDDTLRIRTILTSRILRRARTCMLVYEVTGNGFLHYMVRNIVGTLVEVGQGKRDPSDITRILEARDRRLAGPTAPAQGLCLVRVEY